MNRQELLNQIEHYTPFNEQEETDKQLILNWIRNNTNAFSRENTVAHMTASAWVLIRIKAKFSWSITIFIIPGPGWEGMRTEKRIYLQLPFGK